MYYHLWKPSTIQLQRGKPDGNLRHPTSTSLGSFTTCAWWGIRWKPFSSPQSSKGPFRGDCWWLMDGWIITAVYWWCILNIDCWYICVYIYIYIDGSFSGFCWCWCLMCFIPSQWQRWVKKHLLISPSLDSRELLGWGSECIHRKESLLMDDHNPM